jgi:hypothetical protein
MLVRLAALAASAVLTAGCALPSGASSSGGGGSTGGAAVGGAGEDTCVIGFNPDRRGVNAAHGLVTGSVTVNCSQPTRIHVVVTLFYDGGNGMNHPESATGEFDGTTIDTTVSTKPVNCYEGRYRAAYTSTARANGDVKTQQQVSEVTTLSAGDCR